MIQFISGSHPLTTFHHSSLLSMILMYTWNAKNEWNWLETIDLGRGFDLGHFRGSSREFSLIVKFGRNLFFYVEVWKNLRVREYFLLHWMKDFLFSEAKIWNLFQSSRSSELLLKNKRKKNFSKRIISKVFNITKSLKWECLRCYCGVGGSRVFFFEILRSERDVRREE